MSATFKETHLILKRISNEVLNGILKYLDGSFSYLSYIVVNEQLL